MELLKQLTDSPLGKGRQVRPDPADPGLEFDMEILHISAHLIGLLCTEENDGLSHLKRRRRLCSRKWLFLVEGFLILCGECICASAIQELPVTSSCYLQKVLRFKTLDKFQSIFI